MCKEIQWCCIHPVVPQYIVQLKTLSHQLKIRFVAVLEINHTVVTWYAKVQCFPMHSTATVREKVRPIERSQDWGEGADWTCRGTWGSEVHVAYH